MDTTPTCKRTIIALCGFEGSGKNAAAEMLQKRGFRAVSFAYNLKRAVAVIFGWEFEMLEGLTQESREWREKVDAFWSEALGIPGLTPRKTLQLIGTDVMRKFNDAIWVLSLQRTIALSSDDIVITDCRFPSEVSAIKKWGGCVVRIERDACKPVWLDDFYREHEIEEDRLDMFDIDFQCTECSDEFYASHDVHPAETSLLLHTGIDYTVPNNATLEDLDNAMSKVLAQINPCKYIKRIAIDFDDVILPYMPSFIKFCNEKHNTALTHNDCITLQIERLMGCDESRARDVFNEFADSSYHTEMHDVAPTPECSLTLKKMSERWKLAIVSAREGRFTDITMAYLNKHLPKIFSEVWLCNTYGSSGDKATKKDVCNWIGCQILIDDSAENIASLDNSAILGVIFGDYPWNKMHDGVRANTWGDVMKLLKLE